MSASRGWLAGLVVPLLLVSCEEAPETSPRVARLAELAGDVRVRGRAAAAWGSAHLGQELGAGEQIQTGNSARAVVLFASGARLIVEPGSIVVIEDETTDGDPVDCILVQAGVVRGVLTGTAAPGGLAIRRPDAPRLRLKRASGTSSLGYRVRAVEGGAVEVAVTRGRGELASEEGRPEILEARQAREVRGRGPVGPAIQVLDAPDLLAPADEASFPFVPGVRIELAWAAVPGAGRYRVEVGRDPSFLDVDARATATEPSWVLAPPAPGRYYFRVASASRDGRPGDFGPARRLRVTEVPVQEAPPVPPEETQHTGLKAADQTTEKALAGPKPVRSRGPLELRVPKTVPWKK